MNSMKKKIYNAVFVYPIVSGLVIIASLISSLYLLETTYVDNYKSFTVDILEQTNLGTCKISKMEYEIIKNNSEVDTIISNEKYKLKVMECCNDGEEYRLVIDISNIEYNADGTLDARIFVGRCSLLSLLV